MPTKLPSLLLALLLAAPAARAADPLPPAPALSAEEPAPPAHPGLHTDETEIAETPIVVPPPVPVGILLAWKPMLLSVRVDNGTGQKFGSDKFQPVRFLGRYTFQPQPDTPLVGRVEVEGGQFKSDTQNTFIGSVGTDVTGRAMVGVATRLSSGVTVLASVGAITRYQYGRASGGAPTIGVFGALSNMELELRLFPIITLSLFAEAALAPFPYAAQSDLGELSDTSEFRARIQFSVDLFRDIALDLGYDFTRWHTSFTGSTILGNPQPDQALLFEDREHALTLGVRWKL